MTLAVAGVIFLATLVRSTFGFGEALIAVPLLAFVIPVKVAAPVAALVSVTVAAVVVAQDWRDVQTRSAGWLVVSTIVGIPIGLLILTRVPEPIVKGVLGVVIIAFSVQAMGGVRSRAWRLATDRGAWMFGFAAGVLGGAYGMNGPPLAVYGSMRGWSPAEFRATLQGYFLPASAIGMAGYYLIGLWTPEVTRLYLASLPGVLVAIIAGRFLNRRMSSQRFVAAVYVGLIAIGGLLLLTLL